MTDKTYPPPCRNFPQPPYLSVTLYACAQRVKVEDKNSCAEYIKKYMGMGVHATNGYKLDNQGRGGFVVMYIVDDEKCLNVVISNRGFIVTAVPSKYNNKNAEMDNWDYDELLLTESTRW